MRAIDGQRKRERTERERERERYRETGRQRERQSEYVSACVRACTVTNNLLAVTPIVATIPTKQQHHQQ